eukprot:m.271188 g.271188  ORF g.271188 m.271188 type:complete len:419 (+) comp26869_c0_seq5:233-1489(+)
MLVRARTLAALVAGASGRHRLPGSIRRLASGSSNSESQAQSMQDEYGSMDDAGETFIVPSFELEVGSTLRDVAVRYQTFGKLNKHQNNTIVVCHALTGNAAVQSWWPTMVGPGRAVDTDRYFVVCANVLGSCYGTTGPSTIDPSTGRRYGAAFPHVTIRDTVRLHAQLIKQGLGVDEVLCAIGGSMGGMQALEWSMQNIVTLRSGVVLAAGGRHTPWQIGVSELQRQAIYADPLYAEGHYEPGTPPTKGLSVARQIAMMSYRTHPVYCAKFGRKVTDDKSPLGKQTFQVEEYLRYQGEKFNKRSFDAESYVRLTQLMDSHDIARGRGEYLAVLASIKTPFLIVGITSDILYPVSEQEELASYLGQAELHVIDSPEGHDGFLLEEARISPFVQKFLSKVTVEQRLGLLQAELTKLKARL